MFTIDVMSRVPVYEQLIKQVEDQVLKGIMKEGDKMPSVRSLSMELSTNPNTIQKAFMELDRRGILVSVPLSYSLINLLNHICYLTLTHPCVCKLSYNLLKI